MNSSRTSTSQLNIVNWINGRSHDLPKGSTCSSIVLCIAGQTGASGGTLMRRLHWTRSETPEGRGST